MFLASLSCTCHESGQQRCLVGAQVGREREKGSGDRLHVESCGLEGTSVLGTRRHGSRCCRDRTCA
jgi:hypothetical protein